MHLTYPIENPIEYILAIAHICRAHDWDDRQHLDRRKAHALLKNAVEARRIRCQLEEPGFRPLPITSFDGTGTYSLHTHGGNVEQTTYCQDDLNSEWPITSQKSSPAEDSRDASQRGNKPGDIWIDVALEAGVWLYVNKVPNRLKDFEEFILERANIRSPRKKWSTSSGERYRDRFIQVFEEFAKRIED